MLFSNKIKKFHTSVNVLRAQHNVVTFVFFRFTHKHNHTVICLFFIYIRGLSYVFVCLQVPGS